MYRKLSEQYDKRYQEHLVAFRRRLLETYTPDTTYTDFYPSMGVRTGEPVEFILYGQAVGGWQKEHNYRSPVPDDRTAGSREYSNSHYGDHSPLDWVNVLRYKSTREGLDKAGKEFYKPFGEYNPAQSPFWQLITRVIRSYYGIGDQEWSWAEKLVWSNLYKIAPQSGKAWNPDEGMRVLQRPECVHLMEQELRELQPKYCIVYTGDNWWAPFRIGLQTEMVWTPREVRYVESVERWGSTRIVVVKRERVGSRDAAAEVLEHLDGAPGR